ncbi:S1C family serine protease [Rhizosphaericola mali]|uniref:Trypsin-like peptidase domain-containing protein n=1 Tax=Rhizosphaericola mali TaxID=2545455 RepID=A0A5P2G5P9_9BACT|nr:serine protease [Rhizosphaericola mali]QES89152.1 trypsin-like peptidase domain-containing protein [Rhizosphaericola mali]
MKKEQLLEEIESALFNSKGKISYQDLKNLDHEEGTEIEENILFFNAMKDYADKKHFLSTLHSIQNNLPDTEEKTPGKVVSFFQKYKKVTAIAASIAGITAITITGVTNYFSPKTDESKIQQLSRDIEIIKKTQAVQSSRIKEVASKIPKGAVVKSGGSAFLIDTKGYFITNAHVLNGQGAIVTNTKGQDFKTSIVYVDQTRDLAILKISDKDFKPSKSLPYDIKRNKLDLGQDIFTLGYPRNEIVYNTGYVSAATGFDGDTSTIQVSMMANPGNSGGPIFNKEGQIIGVLSTRETKSEGVSFAIKANEIYQTLDDWKKSDTSAISLKLKESKSLKNTPRTSQIKELEDYIYLVKVY